MLTTSCFFLFVQSRQAAVREGQKKAAAVVVTERRENKRPQACNTSNLPAPRCGVNEVLMLYAGRLLDSNKVDAPPLSEISLPEIEQCEQLWAITWQRAPKGPHLPACAAHAAAPHSFPGHKDCSHLPVCLRKYPVNLFSRIVLIVFFKMRRSFFYTSQSVKVILTHL